MNKKRRTKIREVTTRLTSCIDDLNAIKGEEDEARENIPENLQDGEAYCNSEECSDTIDDAISDIQQVIDALEEI